MVEASGGTVTATQTARGPDLIRCEAAIGDSTTNVDRRQLTGRE